MTITSVGDALSILSFDDGTCESGLGAGTTQAVTDLVDFDVPTQCVQGGLDIVGVTTRMNTGMSINQFAFAQAGGTPPPAGGVPTAPLGSAIPAFGPCPATALTSRTVGPGAAVITGTSNFFAGVQASGFVGRDSNGPPAGRIWLNCGFCGMTQYSPTDLSGARIGRQLDDPGARRGPELRSRRVDGLRRRLRADSKRRISRPGACRTRPFLVWHGRAPHSPSQVPSPAPHCARSSTARCPEMLLGAASITSWSRLSARSISSPC